MSTKVSNLTKAVVKNYPDFNIREDLDYVEDGKKTYGYDYKGILVIRTCRTANLSYLEIDLGEYYGAFNFDFLWEDIPEVVTNACYRKFDGVPEIDMEELIATCEDVIKQLDALEDKVIKETLDMSSVKDRISYERNFLSEIIKSMQNVAWWKIPSDKILKVHESFNAVMKEDRELCETYNALDNRGWKFLSVKEERRLLRDFEKRGYVKFSISDKCYSSLKDDVKLLMGIIASM